MVMKEYAWNGWRIRANRCLWRLRLATLAAPCIELHIHAQPPASAAPDAARVPGVGAARIAWHERRVDVFPEADAWQRGRIEDWLLQSVLPLVAVRLGCVCIHAVAVASSNDAAQLWVGRSGAGKSTAAAHAVRAGARLIADDVVVLQRESGLFGVRLGAATLRLPADVSGEFADLGAAARGPGGRKKHYRVPLVEPARLYPVQRVWVATGVVGQWRSLADLPARGLACLAGQTSHWLSPSARERRQVFHALADLAQQVHSASLPRLSTTV